MTRFTLRFSRALAGKVHTLQDPDAIRTVLTDKAGVYGRSRLQHRLLGPLLGDGLLGSEGEAWSRRRRALLGYFRAGALNPFLDRLQARAEAMAQSWRAGVRDIDPPLRALAFDALTAFLFGAHGPDPKALQTAIEDYLSAVGGAAPGPMMNGPAWLSLKGGRKGRAAIARLRREIEGALGESDTPLIRTLRDIHDGSDGVIDELATLLFAGTEAPAAAIAWGLYGLSRTPEAQAAVRRELCKGGAGAMPLGRAGRAHAVGRVFAEALRLYPPSLVISRDCMKAHMLDGREIRRGDTVMMSQWVVHRHEDLWRDPECFDPDRFLPTSSELVHKFAYFPFGGGPHVCVGAAMAEGMFRTVAGAVLERFDLTPGPTEAVPTARVTLCPEDGILLVLRPR